MRNITEGRVRHHSVGMDAEGAPIRSFTSIDRVLTVSVLPVDQALSLAFTLTVDGASRVRVSAELASPDGTCVFVPYPSIELPDATPRVVELPPAAVTIRTEGVYSFRLLLDGQLTWSREFEVVVGR
jgi:hypothetical protein